ncbi:MAG: response regulator [Deltaproteobacteria bacterium]|nr:response regulator [Deltaproteobacteria bacterium]
MAQILIVDDEATNRDLLRTLLTYRGHRLLEAADGLEAIGTLRDARPDLVIADILMPTMDGYELVRRLRADPAVAATPVIFYTAHYLEREARALAQQCGVELILTKPAEPELILRTVDAALGAAAPPAVEPLAEQFDRDHLRVVADTLAHKVEALEAVTQRLAALIDAVEGLAVERDPPVLLDGVARAARRVIGARHALIAVLDNGTGRWRMLRASGLPAEVAERLSHPPVDRGALASLLGGAAAVRRAGLERASTDSGLPPEYPAVASLLGVPLSSPSRRYGWLCLTDRLGAAEFSADDQHLAVTLGSLAGRVYENGSLYTEVQRRAQALEAEVVERRAAEATLRERTRMSQLAADVGTVLTRGGAVEALMRRCADAVARHLGAVAVGIWIDDATPVALAGAHADAGFVRTLAPLVGQWREGAQPAAVAVEPGAALDRTWLRERGLADVVALPLRVADEALGVLAVCGALPFSPITRDGLAAVADEIAVGLHRAQTAEALQALNAALEERVSERTAALDLANRELEAFSYSVSHDLRSPLRHIDGFSRLLLDEHAAQLNAEGRQHLERIRAGTLRMSQLIDDLLALARVTRHEMRHAVVSLTALAEALVEGLRGGEPERAVDVRIDAGMSARGDADLLRVALGNLLDNAWKYSRHTAQARIAVGCERRDGRAAYYVRDNGAGFDMALAHRLFVPFQRLHSASEFEGTGIGLATVQRIIHRHGGRIWAESAPGHGTTFWFTLENGTASEGPPAPAA